MCGLNGALYFVAMEEDGGVSKTVAPFTNPGAKYGTSYCDAQCPNDIKWIHGEPNFNALDQHAPFDAWIPPRYRSCCAEMDIWEGNAMATAFTPHPCKIPEFKLCENGLAWFRV